MNIDAELLKTIWSTPEIKIDVAGLKDDVPLAAQGVDSLEMMNLMLALEEHFKIKISDQDIETMKSIPDVITYLKARFA